MIFIYVVDNSRGTESDGLDPNVEPAKKTFKPINKKKVSEGDKKDEVLDLTNATDEPSMTWPQAQIKEEVNENEKEKHSESEHDVDLAALSTNDSDERNIFDVDVNRRSKRSKRRASKAKKKRDDYYDYT